MSRPMTYRRKWSTRCFAPGVAYVWAQDIAPHYVTARPHHRRGRICPVTVPPIRLANSAAARPTGPRRHAVPHRAGRHCAGARKQHRHRGEPLQSASSRNGTWSAPKRAVRCRACPAERRKPDRLPADKAWQAARPRRESAFLEARSNGSSSNATVSQIGPVTQNLDPIRAREHHLQPSQRPAARPSAKRRVQPD